MSERPWYRRYGSDFIAGTLGLTLEEKGAYSLILDLIYDRGAPIPDDARYIAGVCGCSLRKWAAIRQRLIDLGKIEASDGYISNRRARAEIEKSAKTAEKHAENGSKGGRKRSENDAAERNNNNLAQARLNHRAHKPEPEPEPEDSSLRSESAALLQRAPARARGAGVSANELSATLHAAAGQAMANTTSAEMMTIPLRWLTAGYDLDADILPVIRAKCARASPRSISGWAYFTRAIQEAYETRTTEIRHDHHHARPRPARRTHADRGEDYLQSTVAAFVDAFGRRSAEARAASLAPADHGGEGGDHSSDP